MDVIPVLHVSKVVDLSHVSLTHGGTRTAILLAPHLLLVMTVGAAVPGAW